MQGPSGGEKSHAGTRKSSPGRRQDPHIGRFALTLYPDCPQDVSEDCFKPFRRQIIGYGHLHEFPCGRRPILYADWAASGRLYRPIEEYLTNDLGPYVANTHTETTTTGTVMTRAYRQAHDIIKHHVHASDDDVLLFAGFGMTAVINKFQRILGLRVPSLLSEAIVRKPSERPVVIITHMEHHSNQTTWEESLCDVEILRRGGDGLPDLDHLEDILKSHAGRRPLIGSFTACSNVTGLITPIHEMAALMHRSGGLCFADYSASAPYVPIDMHPPNPEAHLDAVFFSPHKFLGGPGSSGVIVFDRSLYRNPVPDHPGGGTVLWTNPWGAHRYFSDIEIREDGGTPGVLQAVRASLSVLLKEEMGVRRMLAREDLMKTRLLGGLEEIPGLHVLERENMHRLGYLSFYAEGVHHNLIVRLLNDRFGIQTRGGCSCAGTLGHILLRIDSEASRRITDRIDRGDLGCKPGWVRVSLHPTMTDEDIGFIRGAIREVMKCHAEWGRAYRFNTRTGNFDRMDGAMEEVDLKRVFRSMDSGHA
ncbi:MAG TPA: aminotransferase class V-fold PLP-dependent enzyme [bacterium]|nr:aminotransferase class V-fold PLP-dependent enzyme [bacterium]